MSEQLNQTEAADGQSRLTVGLAPKPHPCDDGEGGRDHDWKFQNDSFDHEYGTERVHYWLCTQCDETRPMEPGDYDEGDDY